MSVNDLRKYNNQYYEIKKAGAWCRTVARWGGADAIFSLCLSSVCCLDYPILPYALSFYWHFVLGPLHFILVFRVLRHPPRTTRRSCRIMRHMPLTKPLRSKLQIWDLQATCSMRSSWTFPLVLNQSLPSTGPSVVAIWTAQGRSFKTCWPSEQIVMYIIMLATICLSAILMWWSI